ncbi:MAG TPA: AMP-binding protein, partial [Spirochaetia bacterium]|nr:AMP-binding protein [Spirochaetia bacterium]
MQESLPKLLKEIVNMNADQNIQWSKDDSGVFRPTTYLEFYHQTEIFAGGLHALGVRHGDNVGLISDNRREWFIADQAILGLGAADVPRGCDSTAKEIHYILG